MLTRTRIIQIALSVVALLILYGIISHPTVNQRIVSIIKKSKESTIDIRDAVPSKTSILISKGLSTATKTLQISTTSGSVSTTASPASPTASKNPLIIFEKDVQSENFTPAKLRYGKGQAQMYVYNSGDLISRSILSGGSWEGGYIGHMESWFDKVPDLQLVDVGCNLGVYSIVAGMRGRQVIAVDANIDNIKRLRKSLVANKIEKNVTLIHNGISDVYSRFSLSSPEAGNIGHSLLAKISGKSNEKLVTSVYMDDLLEVIKFKKAIMKIDIEGHEFEAFHKADKLFTEVNFLAVMMEWAWIGKNKNQNIPIFVKNFFIRFGYKAYPHLLSTTPLSPEAHTQWPWDIVWKKVVSP